MAHREFLDSGGRRWDVWSVHPEYAERRTIGGGVREHPVMERRTRSEIRAQLAGTYSHGWLVFETRGEKRRLTPYPENWSAFSDEELCELLATATLVPHSKRRLVE
jgi:hypothetical protein